MRQHDALGSAGAAAGVEQLGDRVFIEAENIGALGMALIEQFFIGQIGRLGVLFVQGDETLDFRAGGLELLHQRREVIFKQQHARAGMIQDVFQLQRRQPDVQRHHDGARQHHSVIAFQQLMRVEAEIGDAVAALDAVLCEALKPAARSVRRTRGR